MKKKWNKYIFKLSIKRFWKEHVANVLLSLFAIIFTVIGGLFVSMSEPVAKDQKYHEVLNYNKRLEANINFDEIESLDLNQIVSVPGAYINSNLSNIRIFIGKNEKEISCDSLSIYYGNNIQQKCQLIFNDAKALTDEFSIISNAFNLNSSDVGVIINPYVTPTLLLNDDLYKKVNLYNIIYNQVSNIISSPDKLVFRDDIEEGKFYHPSIDTLSVFIKGQRFDFAKTSSSLNSDKLILNPDSFKDAQLESVSLRFSCFQDLVRAEKILKENNISYNIYYDKESDLTRVIQIPKSVTIIISIIGTILFTILIFILVKHSKEKEIYKNLKVNKNLYKNNELIENVLFGVIGVLFASVALFFSIFSFNIGTLFPSLPLYIYPAIYGYIIILSILKYYYGVNRYEN